MYSLRKTLAPLVGCLLIVAAHADDESSLSEELEGDDELLPPDAEEEFEEWRENRGESDDESLFESFGSGDDDSSYNWESGSEQWDTAVPDIDGASSEFGSDFDSGSSAEYLRTPSTEDFMRDMGVGLEDSISGRDMDERQSYSPSSSLRGMDRDSFFDDVYGESGSFEGSSDGDWTTQSVVEAFDPFDFSDPSSSEEEPVGTSLTESQHFRGADSLTPETSEPETREAESFEPQEELEQNPGYNTTPDYLSY